jgi:hypothetical protein
MMKGQPEIIRGRARRKPMTLHRDEIARND